MLAGMRHRDDIWQDPQTLSGLNRSGRINMLFLWGCSLLLSLYVGSFVIFVIDSLFLRTGLVQSLPDPFLDVAPTIYWPLIQLLNLLGV